MAKLRRTDDLEFQVVTFRSSVTGVHLGPAEYFSCRHGTVKQFKHVSLMIN